MSQIEDVSKWQIGQNSEWEKTLSVPEVSTFKVDRRHVINELRLVHEIGSFSGGTGAYIPDHIFQRIKLVANGEPLIDLDKDINTVLMSSEVLAIINQLFQKNMYLPTDTWIIPGRPYLYGPLVKSLQLDVKVGAFADIQDGSQDEMSDAMCYLELFTVNPSYFEEKKREEIGRRPRTEDLIPHYLIRTTEEKRVNIGADAGWQILDLPTGKVIDGMGFLLIVDDDGTPLDELFLEYEIKKDKETLRESHEKLLKMETNRQAKSDIQAGVYHIGFPKSVDTRGVDNFQMKLKIPSGLTDVSVSFISFSRLYSGLPKPEEEERGQVRRERPERRGRDRDRGGRDRDRGGRDRDRGGRGGRGGGGRGGGRGRW